MVEDKNQTKQVDILDSKTSKLEAGIKLSVFLTIGVFLVWATLVGATVLEVSYVNGERANELVNIITPILMSTILVNFVLWLLNRDRQPT